MVDIHEILTGKWEDGTRPKDLYVDIISKDPTEYLDLIIKGLESDEKRVQSGCAELASFLSEERPDLLYSNVDLFLRNLDAKAPVLRWEAVCTLGNLAAVDDDRRIEKHVDRVIGLLEDKSIVLQGHSVRALRKMMERYPERAEDILYAFIESREAFPGNRVGFLVEAMESFVLFPHLRSKASAFAREYLESDSKSVAKKAKGAVRKLDA